MVSKISVPERILEEIRYEGKREAERDKEALGVLLGLYVEGTDSISVLERYPVLTKTGDDTLKGKLYDELKLFLGNPRARYVVAKIRFHRQRARKNGKTVGGGLLSYTSLWFVVG